MNKSHHCIHHLLQIQDLHLQEVLRPQAFSFCTQRSASFLTPVPFRTFSLQQFVYPYQLYLIFFFASPLRLFSFKILQLFVFIFQDILLSFWQLRPLSLFYLHLIFFASQEALVLFVSSPL